MIEIPTGEELAKRASEDTDHGTYPNCMVEVLGRCGVRQGGEGESCRPAGAASVAAECVRMMSLSALSMLALPLLWLLRRTGGIPFTELR